MRTTVVGIFVCLRSEKKVRRILFKFFWQMWVRFEFLNLHRGNVYVIIISLIEMIDVYVSSRRFKIIQERIEQEQLTFSHLTFSHSSLCFFRPREKKIKDFSKKSTETINIRSVSLFFFVREK